MGSRPAEYAINWEEAILTGNALISGYVRLFNGWKKIQLLLCSLFLLVIAKETIIRVLIVLLTMRSFLIGVMKRTPEIFTFGTKDVALILLFVHVLPIPPATEVSTDLFIDQITPQAGDTTPSIAYRLVDLWATNHYREFSYV